MWPFKSTPRKVLTSVKQETPIKGGVLYISFIDGSSEKFLVKDKVKRTKSYTDWKGIFIPAHDYIIDYAGRLSNCHAECTETFDCHAIILKNAKYWEFVREPDTIQLIDSNEYV